ncbi:hypothetical protein ES708_31909 [subsurface metagenome]
MNPVTLTISISCRGPAHVLACQTLTPPRVLAFDELQFTLDDDPKSFPIHLRDEVYIAALVVLIKAFRTLRQAPATGP